VSGERGTCGGICGDEYSKNRKKKCATILIPMPCRKLLPLLSFVSDTSSSLSTYLTPGSLPCHNAIRDLDCRVSCGPVDFSRQSIATQRLAKVRLSGALLVGCQGSSNLCKVGICGLDEGLDGRNDSCGCLALEGFGLEGLDDKGEDLGGLREDSLVLSGRVVSWLL
jgi:hypothetical protein